MENERTGFYLYLTAFTSGMVSLGVELTASRLLAPYFGETHPVWAAIIGLILLYLTVGYFLGGRWADRSPHRATLYQIISWAALLVGLVPFVARPVLLLTARGFESYNVALLVGPFLAVLVLFSVPITLMGCVSPFVIRLLIERVEQAGNMAGRAYAISTAGSLLGTLLPVFVLIPTVGTRDTFLIFSLLLLAVGLVGLARVAPRRALLYLWMPVVLLALALIARGQPIKPLEGAIYETESSYNYIQVAERDGWRLLFLNEGQGIHSAYRPGMQQAGGTWDYFVIGPLFNPPPFSPEQIERVAMIGLAGGTGAKLHTLFFGPIPIDGVEIDPRIVEVGRAFFEMNEPNLNVVVSDGRAFIARSEHRYSVVVLDAYRLPYIPWHLTTVEFFQEVRDHLTDDGVVVINVGRTPGDYRLVEAMVATLQQIFPSTHTMDVAGSYNAIVVATVQPTSPDNLEANIPLLDNPVLQVIASEALGNLRTVEPGPMVFTDDRAPVEMLTHSIVFNYILDR